jgi:hypothetical protein
MSIACVEDLVPLFSLVKLTEGDTIHTANTYGDAVAHVGCQK